MRRLTGAVLTACLPLVACAPKDNRPRGAGGDPVVARIDKQVITARDIEERVAQLEPFSRMRMSSPDHKKRLLDNLVRFEVLALEAQKKGYDRDPDLQRVLKARLVEDFLRREVDDKLPPEDFADAEIEAYYRTNKETFRRPEAVRVSQIFTSDRAKATTAAAEAASAQTDRAFRLVVEKHSEDEDSRIRGGDLTFIERESPQHPPELVTAAFGLTRIGDVSPPVQSDKGFHILRLTERRPAMVRPLAEVNNEIRRMLLTERRGKKIEEIVAEMRKTTKVEVYEDQLAKAFPASPNTPEGAR